MMGDLATGSDRVVAKAGKGAKVARAERVGKGQRVAARVARVAKAAKAGREAATETQFVIPAMLGGEVPVDLGHSVLVKVCVGLTTRKTVLELYSQHLHPNPKFTSLLSSLFSVLR